MFGLGFTEILVILVVALIVLGPEKLPEVARSLGRTLGDFRRTLDEVKREVNIGSLELEEPKQRTLTVTDFTKLDLKEDFCNCETHGSSPHLREDHTADPPHDSNADSGVATNVSTSDVAVQQSKADPEQHG